MRLSSNSHLAYCTNVHPGKDLEETLHSLKTFTLPLRYRIASKQKAFAIGLRLSYKSAQELSHPKTLQKFKRWLKKHNCYVFTINGFPFADFNKGRIKEQVYWPDWTCSDRLSYTNLLFDLIVELEPQSQDLSISTLPGSFKRFINNAEQQTLIFENLLKCHQHILKVADRSGYDLHLGLEPEPLGLFETTEETIRFIHAFRSFAQDHSVQKTIGVNYDTCHMAIQFENAWESLSLFEKESIRISKLHLSSAIKGRYSPAFLKAIHPFVEEKYLHQVVAMNKFGQINRVEDLDQALDPSQFALVESEWRIHFHIPLHTLPEKPLQSTSDHTQDTLDYLIKNPHTTKHIELETYTWEVLPSQFKELSVVEQMEQEYLWALNTLNLEG